MRELEGLGVGKIPLLVIPDHHHKGRTVDDAPLCEWLRDCEGSGHEIVTHGYFHQREPRAKEGAMQRITTTFYTAGEGEFFDPSRAEAAALVGRGNEELCGVGLHPRGFIAPAWLLGVEAEEALRGTGCEYTTRLREVRDLQAGVVHNSQSLCWSVRAAWRRAMSVVWNAALFSRLAHAPLLRIAVHPVDIGHPTIWRQIVRITQAALVTRTPTTYFEWIQHQRTALSPAR